MYIPTLLDFLLFNAATAYTSVNPRIEIFKR